MRVASAILALLVTASSHAAPSGFLSLVAAVSLPGVEGRIDHLSIDPAGNRLFVSALGNNSVEVIGLQTGSVLRSLKGFSEPQGVLYVPELNKLYITNAGNGECDVLDGSTYSLLKRIDLGADADNLHYEPATGRMYISAGNNLVILDVADDRQVGAIAFPGHPEGLVLEHDGSRVFVNVPVPSGSVFVVDRAQAAIKSRWPVGNVFSSAISNFPIALDEKHGLLFVGTRAPALLKAIDISSGKTVADAGTDGDADDISYDPERARVYVSCGAGFVDVFQKEDSGRLAEVGRIATAAGGRTSLWVPEQGRLFVAVPHRGSHAAEIRVYAAE